MRGWLPCRDLSKPVGALTEVRLHLFQERFREMPQGEVTALSPCHLLLRSPLLTGFFVLLLSSGLLMLPQSCVSRDSCRLAGHGRALHVRLALLLPRLRHVLAGARSARAPAAPAGRPLRRARPHVLQHQGGLGQRDLQHCRRQGAHSGVLPVGRQVSSSWPSGCTEHC